MLFKHVVGHQAIKERLISSVQNNRISHAQLFLGMEGSGALAMALAYAQYIQCENKQDNDACGTCRSCIQMNKLVHPDVHFAFPVNTSPSVKKDPLSEKFLKEWREMILKNAYFNRNQWYEALGIENKQGIINKAESEEIIRKLNLKTYESEYKILILWLPELMNATSANMLLKLIEEPPAKTLFILVSESDENLLGTIRSRTQLIKIPLIDKEEIGNALVDKFNIDKEQAKGLAQIANGNFNKALELIKTEEEQDFNFEKFVEIMRYAYLVEVPGILKWVESIAPIGRERLKNFLDYGINLIRENLMMNLKQDNLVYLPLKEHEWSVKFSPYIHIDNVYEIIEEFNLAHAHISQNANAKIVLTDMSLRITKLIKR